MLMINDLPNNSYWSLIGLQYASYTSYLLGMVSNSGIRVGLQDNIWFDNQRKKLATKSALLNRVHQLLAINKSKVMPGKELRNQLFNNL